MSESSTPVVRPGDPRYHALLDRMRAMHEAKSADYGLGHDPLYNLRASQELGIPPWVGVVLRMNDKMSRLKAFCQHGQLKCESVEDSLLDIAAYALLATILLSEQQEANKPTEEDHEDPRRSDTGSAR